MARWFTTQVALARGVAGERAFSILFCKQSLGCLLRFLRCDYGLPFGQTHFLPLHRWRTQRSCMGNEFDDNCSAVGVVGRCVGWVGRSDFRSVCRPLHGLLRSLARSPNPSLVRSLLHSLLRLLAQFLSLVSYLVARSFAHSLSHARSVAG